LRRDALISSDANQGFSPDEAVQYVRAVADAGLDFFEQPVPADDLAGMAAVAAAAGTIATGADEGIHSLEDIRRHHERKAARGVSLKTIKLGGMRAVMEAGRLCDRLGLNVNVSTKTGESSTVCAAIGAPPRSGRWRDQRSLVRKRWPARNDRPVSSAPQWRSRWRCRPLRPAPRRRSSSRPSRAISAAFRCTSPNT